MKLLTTLFAARHELPRLMPLMRDAAVPAWAKIAAVLAAIFVISPLNILGDIPLLGLFDDAALLLFVVHTFTSYAGRYTTVAPAPVSRV